MLLAKLKNTRVEASETKGREPKVCREELRKQIARDLSILTGRSRTMNSRSLPEFETLMAN